MVQAPDLSRELKMIIQLEKPFESALVCEQGAAGQVGVMSMHCLMAQCVPNLTISSEMQQIKSEFVFLIDRSGEPVGLDGIYWKSSP